MDAANVFTRRNTKRFGALKDCMTFNYHLADF